MNNKVKKFIINEKEIATYKLEMLQALGPKRYRERLILKEKEFIDYDFGGLDINSLPEIRNATTLFRVDRAAFSLKYERESFLEENSKASIRDISRLNLKISHLTDVFLDIVNVKIQELNFVDSKYLKDYYGKKHSSVTIEEALTEEGVIAAKHRARLQLMLFSFARYIYSTVKESSKIIESENISYADVITLNKTLDGIFYNYSPNIFSYYNDSIEQLPEVLKNKRGENRFVGSIYPLKNICAISEDPFIFRRHLSAHKDILSKTGKPIKKKYTARAYSMDTGISRVGNENIELLYCDIYSSRKNRITEIIEKSFYNLASEDGYTKAISTIPIWEMKEVDLSEGVKREVFELIGTDSIPMNQSILSKDEGVIKLINNNMAGTLKIDKSISKILVAATRSESEKIVEAKKYIDLLINSLNKEYESKFASSVNLDLKSMEARKSKVKEIIGSIFNG